MKYIIVLLLLLPLNAFAMKADQKVLPEKVKKEDLSPLPESLFERPDYTEIITKSAGSLKYTFDNAFTKDNLDDWFYIFASTSILYQYDLDMVLEVQRWGRNAGLGNADRTKSMLKIGSINVFRGPTDLGSFLYFLGDGWVHIGMAFGLWGYGHNYENNRALVTGFQMLHGMAVSTIFNQILKRSTGRETPEKRTRPRGEWRPFPSFNEYNSKTPVYDAFPSGHVMTASHTLTILYENYPEYRYWIMPTGITAITLLSLQMMNNGVHWASDYPLGIAMGVFFGKMSAKMWRTDKAHENKKYYSRSMLLPMTDNGTLGLQWLKTF